MAARKKLWNVTTPDGLPIIPEKFVCASDAGLKEGMFCTISSNAIAAVSNAATSAVGVVAADQETSATECLVYRAPRIRAKAIATTPANLTTSTRLTLVTIDVSSDDHTVDENDTSSGFIRLLEVGDTSTGEVMVEFNTTV